MDDSSLRGEVEAAYAAWNEAFNQGDPIAVAALYADGATFLPATHDVLAAPDGVAQFFQGLFANGVTGHTLDLITVHGDMRTIVAAARWSVRGANADGSPATFSGVATHVFVRQADGGLKLKLHTFN